MNRRSAAGVEGGVEAKYDTWKKLVIGTRRRFDPIDSKVGGGNHYFFEEATWPKGDGAPKIVAQVHPDFGTINDEGRYLWAVLWDFADGPWRDHGKIVGRSEAKTICLQVVRDGVRAAHERRQAARKELEAQQPSVWAAAVATEIDDAERGVYDDVPDDA